MSQAIFDSIIDFTIDLSGRFVISGRAGLTVGIFRENRDLALELIAGNSDVPFSDDDDVPATSVRLRYPIGLAAGPAGEIYFSDILQSIDNQRIQVIRTDGTIGAAVGKSTASGSGATPFPLEGLPGTDVKLRNLADLTLGPDGSLFFASQCNITRLGVDGVLHDVAGTNGCLQDREATNTQTEAKEAKLPPITRLAVDANGFVLFMANDNRTFMVDPARGPVRPVAGEHSEPCSNFVYNDPGCSSLPEGAPALGRYVGKFTSIDIGPDGIPYFLTTPAGPGTNRTVVLEHPRAEVASQIVVPSEDGSEVYVFDGNGRHQTTKHALTDAVLYSFAYDANGHLSSITDGDGNTTSIERDASGVLTGVIGPFGQRTELSEDSNGYLETIQPDPNELPYSFVYYDDLGLMASMTDPKGQLHTATFEDGLLTEDAAPDGRTLSLSRFVDDSLIQVELTETDAGLTTFQIDRTSPEELVSTIAEPDGTQSSIRQRLDGVTTDVRADGTIITTTVDPDPEYGLLAPNTTVTTTLPSGLTRTVSESATITDSGPDLVRTTTIDVNGRILTTVFDRAIRRAMVTTPEGRTLDATLDAQQRPTRIAMPGVETINYTYDAQGRLNAITQGLGAGARTVTATYYPSDPAQPEIEGYLESLSGPLTGAVTSFSPDAVGRPLVVTRPDGAGVALTYDAVGNVATVTPPGQPAHTFTHTPGELIDTYTAPPADGADLPAVTDLDYNLARRADLVTLADGRVVNFSRDPVSGKLSSVTTADTTYAYSYSATTGQLDLMTRTDAAGLHTLEFDYDGFLPTTTTWGGVAGMTAGSVGATYDADFRVDQVLVNGTSIVDYDYDQDGLLELAGPLDLQRNPDNGFLEGTTLDQVATTQTYTPYAELDTLTVTHGSDMLYSDAVTQRDGLSRVLERTVTVGTQVRAYSYSYDAAGRLVLVSLGSVQTDQYVYDTNGNRDRHVTSAGTVRGRYDNQDRLTRYCPEDANDEPAPIAGLPCFSNTYRDSGQLLRRTDLDSGAVTDYDYDEGGGLRRVDLPDRTIAYELDALGRRVGRLVDGVKQQGLLYLDAINPVAEIDASGAVTSTFVYATRGHVPDSMVKDGTIYRLVTDGRGSVVMVVDSATGVVAQQLDYDEFGNVLLDTNPGFQPFGFAGGLYDADTGLVRFGARDYDPVVGRWTSKDPLIFGGGSSNLYTYTGNDPINLIDFTGLTPAHAAAGAISAGVLAGAVVGASLEAGRQLRSGGINDSGAIAGAAALGAGLGALAGATAGLGLLAEAGLLSSSQLAAATAAIGSAGLLAKLAQWLGNGDLEKGISGELAKLLCQVLGGTGPTCDVAGEVGREAYEDAKCP